MRIHVCMCVYFIHNVSEEVNNVRFSHSKYLSFERETKFQQILNTNIYFPKLYLCFKYLIVLNLRKNSVDLKRMTDGRTLFWNLKFDFTNASRRELNISAPEQNCYYWK